LFHVNNENKFNDLIDFIKKECEIMNNNIKTKAVIYSKNIRIPERFSTYKYRDVILLMMRYDNLEFIGYGNQWTMRYIEEMKFLNEHNYIEVFASPFNHTLKKYCSMFEEDKIFGSMGPYEVFFEKLLKGDEKFETPINLCVSPPSGYTIQKYTVDKLLQILDKYPTNVSLSMSAYKRNF